MGKKPEKSKTVPKKPKTSGTVYITEGETIANVDKKKQSGS